MGGSSSSLSMRRYLLLGILLPVMIFILIDSAVLYRQSLAAANRAYDRTLLASAKTIAEQLDVVGEEGSETQPLRLVPRLPYAALEAFEADNRSRMFYRITGFSGELVSGFESLKPWTGRIPDQPPYAALVDFYDDWVGDARVRVAVLLQPVAGLGGAGMATVQVAETLELREALAREILLSTLWRQALLLTLIAAVVIWVVQRAVKPVRNLSAEIARRSADDLQPVATQAAPRELLPLLEANNQLMARLDHLLQHQKRFVRDAAHQLRTPLAVLKVQTQSALRGDLPAQEALQGIAQTVERATSLANQMLSLAKIEQLRQQPESRRIEWSAIVREVALETAPLMAEKDIEFEIDTQPTHVLAHEWMLKELARNLLHNAVKHTPAGGTISVRLQAEAAKAVLTISDTGSGIDEALRQRLFQPFSAGNAQTGAGLGLAICAEIVRVLQGEIELNNRSKDQVVQGLDVRVSLPRC